MTFGLLKLSYNKIGENTLKGGICGAGFFINKKTFLTAHHIFNSNNNEPNMGFKFCQYWLISNNGEIIELINPKITNYPNIDTTVIKFPTNITSNTVGIKLKIPDAGDKIYNQGFYPDMPQIEANWSTDKLVISSADLSNLVSNASGTIREINKVTIKANDVNIQDKILITTSYPGIVGMSGGPMFDSKNNVIGLMSIGLPADVPNKDFVGAIWIDEIMKSI